MELSALVAGVGAHLDGALLALDFDGTLAPIVADPAHSRLAPGASSVLTRLAAAGASVAVITGRDVPTLLELTDLSRVPGLRVAGLYGAQTWHDGELSAVPMPAAVAQLRTVLPGVLVAEHADPDVWIEDKHLSLVVHGRLAADPAAALAPLRAPLQRLADDLGLELHPGRGVLELRVPGYDKAAALRQLVVDVQPRVVLFAGDDLGDLPAFEQIARLRDEGLAAWALAVRSDEAPQIAAAADLAVADPAELVRVLESIAAQPSASS